MKLILLGGKKGKDVFVKVDDEDYDYLNQFYWCLLPGAYTCYAVSNVDGKHVLMHRLLMKPGFRIVVDHINSDGLDNRKSNLRKCSQSQNCHNRRKLKQGNSIYKGVCWDARHRGKWYGMINYEGKNRNLGTFSEERWAALAYDLWAVHLHGEFARTNFKVEKWG